MRKIRSLNAQNRKGESEPKDRKERVPILKNTSTELTSFKDIYNFNDYYESDFKYAYGVNGTTIDKGNLVIKTTEGGITITKVTIDSWNTKFYVGDNEEESMFIFLIVKYYYYFKPIIGERAFIYLKPYEYPPTMNSENYKRALTLLKDDIPEVVEDINSMTTTQIDLDTVTDLELINKTIQEPEFKYGKCNISLVEVFNLYELYTRELESWMPNYDMAYVLNNTLKFIFNNNTRYIELRNMTSSLKENEYRLYLSYYTEPNDYQIWNCNTLTNLPNLTGNNDKTIVINGTTYYKVLLVYTGDNSYEPLLYFDWGDFDPEEIIKLDPKSIEPQKLTPTSYYKYMKQVYNHITPLAAYMYNYSGSSGELYGKENNQNKPFNSLLNDYKSNFDSSEVYTYWSVKIHLYDFGITVLDYITENLEIIKSFYPNYNFDTSTSEGRANIEEITGGFIGYIDYYYLRDNRIKPSYDQVGSFIDELFIYDPQKLPGSYNDVYYTPEDFLSKRPTLPPMPEGYKLYIEDIGEYTLTMNYIYSKQNSIIMSMDELTTEDKEDIESYTKYTITN